MGVNAVFAPRWQGSRSSPRTNGDPMNSFPISLRQSLARCLVLACAAGVGACSPQVDVAECVGAAGAGGSTSSS